MFSAITVSVDRKMKFEPIPPNSSESRVGRVVIPSNATILVNDGQHRCAAMRSAYEQNEDIGRERIPVVIFEDRGLKRSQQMFADLNQNAVKPTKSLALLYDHRDTFARFVKTMVYDVEIFNGRTEMEHTNISNRSKCFFTLNGIADATRRLLDLKSQTKSISAEKQKLAVEYWTRVSRNIPQWNLMMDGKMSPHEIRQTYVHAYTNVLNALGLAGNVLTKRKDWREKVKGLQEINWSRGGPAWQNKVVMDGKMLKNRVGIKRAANEILNKLDVSDTVDSAA